MYSRKYSNMTKLRLIVFLLGASIAGMECSSVFSKQQDLYREWKCKSIHSKNKIYPEEYDCSHVFKTPKDKCFVQGSIYRDRQTIKASGLERICHFDCFCDTDCVGSRVKCASVNCPTFTPACNKSYYPVFDKFDQCCARRARALPKSTPKCHHKDYVYLEGQRVNQDNCSTCICKQDGIECERNKCFEELDHIKEIVNKCAPIFDEERCCPIGWICRDESADVSLPPYIVEQVKPLSKCQFGDQLMSYGDALIRPTDKKRGIMCVCKIPPLLTCWHYKTNQRQLTHYSV